MKALLQSALSSKKALATLVGLLVVVLSYPMTRWFGFDEAHAAEVAGPIASKAVALVASYVVGQGLADVGKEAKKVGGGS